MQINVLEYLARTSQLSPDKTFLVGGGKSYTFHEVLYLVNNLAAEIKKTTTAVGKPIPVLAPKSVESIISFFAIIASRNIYCPIDVSSAPERIEAIIGRLSPDLVISDSDKPGYQIVSLNELSARLPKFLPPIAESVRKLDELCVGHIDLDPAYIIHTSGSTGVPKGVTISHRSIIDYIDWAVDCYGHTAEDKILNQAPLHFDNSTLDIYLSLAVGAELHVVPEAHYVFLPKLIDYLNTMKITSVFWVPSVLVNMANLKLLDKFEIKTLSKILFAGEVMPVAQLNYWIRKLPTALFSNLYGPTEITVDCTYFTLQGEWSGDSLPIGYPCRNSGVFVLNEMGSLAAPGEIGELCVRGSSLALGYWNMPEKTDEVFVPNPAITAYRDLIYKTGDLVKKENDGLLYFVGRKDTQIKHHGYRIELGEIEASISGFPGVQQVIVVYDSEKKRICAFYSTDEDLTDDQIKKSIINRLPAYMLPSVYSKVSEFPLNANGKVDRMKLTSMAKEIV